MGGTFLNFLLEYVNESQVNVCVVQLVHSKAVFLILMLFVVGGRVLLEHSEVHLSGVCGCSYVSEFAQDFWASMSTELFLLVAFGCR